MSNMEKAIIFRDLQAEGLHGYELQDLQPDSMMLKEQIIPGMHGFPPMHIRHMSLTYRGKRIAILCQTDYELDAAKAVGVLAGALKLLKSSRLP